MCELVRRHSHQRLLQKDSFEKSQTLTELRLTGNFILYFKLYVNNQL